MKTKMDVAGSGQQFTAHAWDLLVTAIHVNLLLMEACHGWPAKVGQEVGIPAPHLNDNSIPHTCCQLCKLLLVFR